MTLFRLLLIAIIVTVVVYTIPVVYSEGLLTLLPSFFGEMMRLNWQGQFNLDFFTFLILSGTWVAWRNQFSVRGNLLGIGAVFLGAPYLSIYLIYLSYTCKGDLKRIFLGDREL